MKLPFALEVIAGIESQHPVAGHGGLGQCQSLLIESRVRLPDKGPHHLTIGLHQLRFYRLGGQRMSVSITKQRIDDDDFAWTIDIARPEDKQLFVIALRSGNRKLSEIQRRTRQVDHRGLFTLHGQQDPAFFIRLEAQMTGVVTGPALQHLPFRIQQPDADAGQWLAVCQALGEQFKLGREAMQREANVAQSEKRGGLAVAISSGLFHYRQIDAWFLKRSYFTHRQLQFFAGVTRRVKLKATGIDQLAAFQQILRLPAGEVIAVIPLREKFCQAGIFYPEEVDIDLVNIQRQHRQSLRDTQRQQRSATGKPDHRLDITGGNFLAVIVGEGFTAGRAQSRIHRDGEVTRGFRMAEAQRFAVSG